MRTSLKNLLSESTTIEAPIAENAPLIVTDNVIVGNTATTTFRNTLKFIDAKANEKGIKLAEHCNTDADGRNITNLEQLRKIEKQIDKERAANFISTPAKAKVTPTPRVKKETTEGSITHAVNTLPVGSTIRYKASEKTYQIVESTETLIVLLNEATEKKMNIKAAKCLVEQVILVKAI
jgi:hypothetical protein